MISETHANAAQRDMPIREITAPTAAAAGQVELMAGIDGAQQLGRAQDLLTRAATNERRAARR